MLDRLEVSGLGIIDAVTLELSEGFSVLTGETGAGKSLLVESLKLLAGGRAQAELVRSGEQRLVVDGWFSAVRGELDNSGLAPEDAEAQGEIVIRREVTAAGRSRCWINGAPATVGNLQRLAPRLMAVHGQHEQYGLADGTVQRQVIDEFAGHADLLTEVGEAYDDWEATCRRLTELEKRVAQRRDRLDVIAFQLGEIDAVDPLSGEDQELQQRRQMLRHAVRLQELTSSVLARLADDEDSVADRLAQALRAIEEMVELGVGLEDGQKRLGEAMVSVDETVRELQVGVGEIREDPGELEDIEARLHRLEQLMLKYGSPLDKVLEHATALRHERTELGAIEIDLSRLQEEERSALEEFRSKAVQLDEARAAAGEQLAAQTSRVLGDLEMGGTVLRFEWSPRLAADGVLEWFGERAIPARDGMSECELLIAANPGEEPRPMSKIASGGELSRIHLAIRTVLRGARSKSGLTLLFDEVDSGLGGQAAASLADLLASLSSVDQVLVVTHLPQVAACADDHLRVEKVLESGRAVTRVERLDRDARVDEIARMLSGSDVGDSARAHAEALLGDG